MSPTPQLCSDGHANSGTSKPLFRRFIGAALALIAFI
jgi:hypothetical protein